MKLDQPVVAVRNSGRQPLPLTRRLRGQDRHQLSGAVRDRRVRGEPNDRDGVGPVVNIQDGGTPTHGDFAVFGRALLHEADDLAGCHREELEFFRRDLRRDDLAAGVDNGIPHCDVVGGFDAEAAVVFGEVPEEAPCASIQPVPCRLLGVHMYQRAPKTRFKLR